MSFEMGGYVKDQSRKENIVIIVATKADWNTVIFEKNNC